MMPRLDTRADNVLRHSGNSWQWNEQHSNETGTAKSPLSSGAASGIGHAIAKRYLEADGRVVIADLNLEAARRAADALAHTKSAIGSVWCRERGSGLCRD